MGTRDDRLGNWDRRFEAKPVISGRFPMGAPPAGTRMRVTSRARLLWTGKRWVQRRKNDLIYLLAMVGMGVFRALPPRLGLRVGAFLGGLAYILLPRERARALESLATAFAGEKSLEERKRIARRSFRNLGRSAAEMMNLPRIRRQLDRWVSSVEGREHLDGALAKGRGVLWLTAHLGNWEMIGWTMASLGYPVNVVARAVYDERLNRLLLKFREDASVRVILRDSPSAGREILQALKRGEVLGMLIDQDTKVKGVMAGFFGEKANTPAGPAVLAVRRQVPVVAGFIHRETDGRHRIVIYPPIELRCTGDPERDVQENTERFNLVIEEEIRRYPDQWVWMHRRWRRKEPYDPSTEWKVHLNL